MVDVVRQAPLFAALDDEAAATLRATMVPQDVLRGAVLFAEGDPGDRLYVIVTGKVKLSRASGYGRENLLSVLGPGEMFGELSLFDPGERNASAVALADTSLISLGSDDLLDWLTGRSDVARHLLQALARRLRRTNENLVDLVFSDVSGRVARALLDLSDRFGHRTDEGVWVTHDLTQEELAQLVGATRETVNKVLGDFVMRGWVRLDARAVLLIDPDKIRGRAR